MMDGYNWRLASAAQRNYCEERESPMFAPSAGICYHCGFNIYMPVNGTRGTVSGITVNEAASKLITSCPHCHYSFVE